MMTNDFFDVALPPFRFLTESGRYQITHQHASSTCDMGTIAFESPTLHILFGREHGAFFLDVACVSQAEDPDQWYGFPLVRRLLDVDSEDAVNDSNSISISLPFVTADSAANELRQYLSRVEHAFAPERIADTRSSLEAIQTRLSHPYSCWFDNGNESRGDGDA
jgi:hypothetical protein